MNQFLKRLSEQKIDNEIVTEEKYRRYLIRIGKAIGERAYFDAEGKRHECIQIDRLVDIIESDYDGTSLSDIFRQEAEECIESSKNNSEPYGDIFRLISVSLESISQKLKDKGL